MSTPRSSSPPLRSPNNSAGTPHEHPTEFFSSAALPRTTPRGPRMSITESAKFAWRGLTANKPRSALTMLGVLIGVASVIILVGVGTGASQASPTRSAHWAPTP